VVRIRAATRRAAPLHPARCVAHARAAPRNQLIHVVFVPVIFLTAAVWLSYTPTLLSLSLPLPLGAGGAPLVVNVNGAALFFAVYAAFYVLLDPLAGLSWAALMLPGLRFAMQYAKVCARAHIHAHTHCALSALILRAE
jgi:uncharacterized membrane protein YGL010W